jgi:beta-phosphoglucomutase-like phosphatase (HAD superfamily)
LTGLARYFEDVFSTQYVAHGKPAPDIFLYASEKMGAAPETAVVIEDSAPGVQGARAAGTRAIGYLGGAHVVGGHAERLKQAGANFVAKDWAQVRHYLATPAVHGL